MILIVTAAGVITLAQLNYEQAVEKAAKVDTDGEIQAVLFEHGFRCGIYDRVTTGDKIEAFFIVMSDEKAN